MYALVTGGSKGIGKCIAEELAKKKYDLLLVARSENELKELAKQLSTQYGITCDYLPMDLSEIGASGKLYSFCMEKKYDLNVLVNNAGYGLSGPFDGYTLEQHQKMMQVNMNTLVELCYLFLPKLKSQTQAYILNIASTAAYQSVPGLNLYAASKAFVLSFSRGLKYELKKTSVSVTCISPGGTDTNFSNRAKVSAKAIKAGEKVNMTPEAVAKIAVDGMFAKKTEVITGFVNKLGTFMVWLLPKALTEKVAAGIYTT
jgi:short-subunit dehydrogenase